MAAQKDLLVWGKYTWKCVGIKDHDICNLVSDGFENKCGEMLTIGESGEKFSVVH